MTTSFVLTSYDRDVLSLWASKTARWFS
jgi:hypothetical protein